MNKDCPFLVSLYFSYTKDLAPAYNWTIERGDKGFPGKISGGQFDWDGSL